MEYTYTQMIYSHHYQKQSQQDEKNINKNNYLKQGLVIISEFVSSARPMQGGIIINPWKIDQVKYFFLLLLLIVILSILLLGCK